MKRSLNIYIFFLVFAADRVFGESGAAAAAKPWFTNVASQAGIEPFDGARNKFTDINGDGWADIILLGNGGEWMKEFLKRNGFPDGLPPGKEGELQIPLGDWKGDKGDFEMFDFNGDGVLTRPELSVGRPGNRLHAFVSVSAEGGGLRFVEVTEASGIRQNSKGTRRGRLTRLIVAADIDDDGDIDLFSGAYLDFKNPKSKAPDTGDRSCWLMNDGKGKFSLYEQPAPAEDSKGADRILGPNAFPSTISGACTVDVNNDGKLDLFTGSWYFAYGSGEQAYQERLFVGLGNGRLRDVTREAGMLMHRSAHDLLTDEQRKSGRMSMKVYLQLGRYSAKPSYGVAHADWDNDGDQDLFVLSYGRQWNLHWENLGNMRFREIGQLTGFDGDEMDVGNYPKWAVDFFKKKHGQPRPKEPPYRSNGNTFGSDFGDWNGDGYLDAILGEIRHGWAGPSSDPSMILTNRGPKGKWAFQRQPGLLKRVHPTPNFNEGDINVAWIDADNDGYLDVLVSSSDYPDDQRLRLFRQDPKTNKFKDVTKEIGLDWPFSTQLSLSDFDRDGDTDILAGRSHARLNAETRKAHPLHTALWRNDIANRLGNHFISIRLEGRGWKNGGANRGAIGARVIVTAGGRTQTREISGGHGHLSCQNDPRLVFGLGKTIKVDRIEIRWGGPANTVDVHENLKGDRFLYFKEGFPQPTTENVNQVTPSN